MKTDFAKPLPKEIDRARHESLALKLSFYALAILVGVMLWSGL